MLVSGKAILRLGLLLFCCQQVSLSWRQGSCRNSGESPAGMWGFCGCFQSWQFPYPSGGPQFPRLSGGGKKHGHRVAVRKGSDLVEKCLCTSEGPAQASVWTSWSHSLPPATRLRAQSGGDCPVPAHSDIGHRPCIAHSHILPHTEQPPPRQQVPSSAPPDRKELHFELSPAIGLTVDSVVSYPTASHLRPRSSPAGGSGQGCLLPGPTAAPWVTGQPL